MITSQETTPIMQDLNVLGFLTHGGIDPNSYAACLQKSFGSEVQNSWFAAAQAVASINSMTYSKNNIVKQRNEIIKRYDKLKDCLNNDEIEIEFETPDEYVAINFVKIQLQQFVEKFSLEEILEEFMKRGLQQEQNIIESDSSEELQHLTDDDECDCKKCLGGNNKVKQKIDEPVFKVPENPKLQTLEVPKRGTKSSKKPVKIMQTTDNWVTKPATKNTTTTTHSGTKVLVNKNKSYKQTERSLNWKNRQSLNSYSKQELDLGLNNLLISKPSGTRASTRSFETNTTTDSENDSGSSQRPKREKVQLLTRPRSILSEAVNFREVSSAMQKHNLEAGRAISIAEEKSRERSKKTARLMTKNSKIQNQQHQTKRTGKSPLRISPWNDPSVVSVNLPKAQKYAKPRPIILDASNIAIAHCQVTQSNGPQHKRTFSCQGIELAIDYFKSRGHESVIAILPAYRQFKNHRGDNRQNKKEGVRYPTVDGYILRHLEKQGCIFYAPTKRRTNNDTDGYSDENSSANYLPVGGLSSSISKPGIRESSPISKERDEKTKHKDYYDDLFILRYAAEKNGVVVSNDHYRDVHKKASNEKRHQLKHIIENNLLGYMFVGDTFMPCEDPYEHVNLSDFLGSEAKC